MTRSIGAAAQFNGPYGIALGPSGSLYVSDPVNRTIRKITSSGVVTTIAGAASKAGVAPGPGSLSASQVRETATRPHRFPMPTRATSPTCSARPTISLRRRWSSSTAPTPIPTPRSAARSASRGAPPGRGGARAAGVPDAAGRRARVPEPPTRSWGPRERSAR